MSVFCPLPLRRNPTTYQCDLAETPIVQHLGQDKQYAGLVQLLRVTLAGDMAGFKAAATPAVLEQAGVTAEAAQYKARMIALLALGGKAAHEEVCCAAASAAAVAAVWWWMPTQKFRYHARHQISLL